MYILTETSTRSSVENTTSTNPAPASVPLPLTESVPLPRELSIQGTSYSNVLLCSKSTNYFINNISLFN